MGYAQYPPRKQYSKHSLFNAWPDTTAKKRGGISLFDAISLQRLTEDLSQGHGHPSPALRSRALENIRGDVMGMLSDGLFYYNPTQTIDNQLDK